MESFTPLLEKTRIPQPSLQKLAVISLFDKFRSNPSSPAGRDAVSRCLRSVSPAVIDQSTRELCRLVKDSKLDISTGLLELQSAIEESSNPQFASVFIKAIGFLTALGFIENPSSFRFRSSEIHPFVKILSCGLAVEGELVKQVIIFIMKCKQLGMAAVCEFLGPFLNYSIIRISDLGSSSAIVRNLMSTMAGFCCSFPQEAIPVIKLWMGRLKYFPSKIAEEVSNISYIAECLVDVYLVVLRQLVGMGLLVHEAQLCGLALLEAILSQHRDFRKCSGLLEKILDLSRHLLEVQKELGLYYVTELSSVTLYLFPTLIESEIEHEQYSVLKLILFILGWKSENGYHGGTAASELSEELLFIFPVLALVSSPSRSIKQTASNLLFVLANIATTLLLIAPKEKEVLEGKHPSVSSPGVIVFKCLRNLWFEDQLSLSGSFYVKSFPNGEVYVNEEHCKQKTWTSSVREYYLGIVGKHRPTATISQSEEIVLTEMPLILCAISSVLLLHQTGNSAIDLLSIGSVMEPKLGVPLLLIILFYNHIFSSTDKDKDSHDMLLNFLGLLPSLASHPAMTPLIFQILLPMLHKDVNHVVKAPAIRLICKTWETNDRVFGTLQEVLHPNGLSQFASEREICISIAVSIQDVCKRNPDRGVDIILSVEACIENHDPLVQFLGLKSLAHLCEADVIDFYSAWDVMAKHVQNYLGNAIIAHGLSLLLRWGAMDAEAYPEAATNVLNILWDIGSYRDVNQKSLWTRAQEAAFSALFQYEVIHIQRSIPDFSTRNMELFISLANPDLLRALEEFEVRIINYEHITRRRFVKQRKVSGSKIVKLLDVVPEVIFGSGSNHKIKDLPGAALLCLPTHKNAKNQGVSKGLEDVHAKYGEATLEISASLQLSRNILLALLSLQSWKPFMQRWMRSCITVFEEKVDPPVLDKTSKAANDILKALTRLAEGAIPRSAENIALSVGAFCMVLPASAHAVKSMASKFLLNWLAQHEHEYRQWPAAISLGLISSCLHVTDHKQKFKNINALIELASCSKSTLVRGACAIGLGFSCQDLLIRVDPEANTQFEKETYKAQETELLRKIVGTLVQMICQFTGSSADILENLAVYFPLGTTDFASAQVVELLCEDVDHREVDTWGIAGPIIGLGHSLGAIYRAGAPDAVRYLKALIISWLPSADESALTETCLEISSLGSCLALPTVVSFCQRVELIEDTELNHLLSSLIGLMSELLLVGRSDIFHQTLLMASCAGAGSLLSIVANAGLLLEVDHLKGFLALFRRTYSSPHPPFIHLGGMLGVVNVMGACAGTLVQQFLLPFPRTTFDQKDSSLGSLPSNHVLEAESTSLVQEIFLIAQNSEDPLLQQYAAWSVSFLRHFIFTRTQSDEETIVHDVSGVPNSISHGFAEDSLVMKLTMWLMQMNYAELGTRVKIRTIAFALRCLSHAPRLPSSDWGTVIRCCMKYGGQAAEMPSSDLTSTKGTLREECFLFSLSHANKFDSLLGFLDELSDLARFKTLESNLQSLVLLHLADLLKIFSNSRLVKLFDDVTNFSHWIVSSDQYNQAQKTSLRVSCWKGLQNCLNEVDLEAQDYAYNFEYCMEVLFVMLPRFHLGVTVESYQRNSSVEWSEAIRCLGKARQGWLSNLLLVSDGSCKEENDQKFKILKKFQAKAALVRTGSIPLSELAKFKAYMLDTNPEVIWNILVEVAVTLQYTDENARRQWFVDSAEILCVTSYPSTALRFLGLLSGSFCKYMPILIVDKFSVLSDLPVTLSSLLLCTGWEMVAESVALYIWKATERIHDWARCVERGDYLPGSQPIDPTENDMGVFLLQVMHQTCISLKEYLSKDKQLRLANMVLI